MIALDSTRPGKILWKVENTWDFLNPDYMQLEQEYVSPKSQCVANARKRRSLSLLTC